MLLVTWDPIVNETNLPICAVFVIDDSLSWKSSCRLSVPSHVHKDCSLALRYPCAGSPSNIAFNSGRFWTGLGFFLLDLLLVGHVCTCRMDALCILGVFLTEGMV